MVGVSHMPQLKALVDAFRDEYGSSESWVSEQIGLDRRGLWNWWNNGLSQIPHPYLLHRLAATIRKPYRDVLDAALHDFQYLPEMTAAQTEPPRRIANRRGPRDVGGDA